MGKWESLTIEQKMAWMEEAITELMEHFSLLPCNIVFERRQDKSKGEFARAMGVQYNYPYPHLVVVVMPLFFKMGEQEARQTIFHEVMHLLLWELKHFRNESQKVWNDLEEKVVEKLAMFFIATLSPPNQ